MGKNSPDKMLSKDSSNNDKIKFDQMNGLGLEKNGMIGKKRSRNEVSFSNEDGCNNLESGHSFNIQNESKDSIGL